MRYHVKGYTVRGELLLHTKHGTEWSRDVELRVWKKRMTNPEDPAAFVEVIDTMAGTVEKVYPPEPRPTGAKREAGNG